MAEGFARAGQAIDVNNPEDLKYLLENPEWFDAQRYWDDNEDLQTHYGGDGMGTPSGNQATEEEKRWALKWGSFTGEGGQELGGMMSHYTGGIRDGHQRQAYWRDEADETFNDVYGHEYLTDIAGAPEGHQATDARALTNARWWDLGLERYGEGESGDADKWGLTFDQPSLLGSANQGMFNTAAGLYADSGIAPTLDSIKALPGLAKTYNYNDEQMGLITEYMENFGKDYLVNEITETAQGRADESSDRTAGEALGLSLLGASGTTFTNDTAGQDYWLAESLQDALGTRSIDAGDGNVLPEIPDDWVPPDFDPLEPFDPNDPKFGGLTDEQRLILEGQAVNEKTALQRVGSITDAISGAVGTAMSSAQATMPGNTAGITEAMSNISSYMTPGNLTNAASYLPGPLGGAAGIASGVGSLAGGPMSVGGMIGAAGKVASGLGSFGVKAAGPLGAALGLVGSGFNVSDANTRMTGAGIPEAQQPGNVNMFLQDALIPFRSADDAATAAISDFARGFMPSGNYGGQEGVIAEAMGNAIGATGGTVETAQGLASSLDPAYFQQHTIDPGFFMTRPAVPKPPVGITPLNPPAGSAGWMYGGSPVINQPLAPGALGGGGYPMGPISASVEPVVAPTVPSFSK